MQVLKSFLTERLSPLGSNAGNPDPMVQFKFFIPGFHWAWYAIEYDGDDVFFGFVDGDFPESGYFRLSELLALSGKRRSSLERDLDFKQCRLSTLRVRPAR